jgi:hypothetical protein
VSALRVSEDFHILKDDDETIVTILAPKLEVEAPAAEVEGAPEKPAEGEEKAEGGEEK